MSRKVKHAPVVQYKRADGSMVTINQSTYNQASALGNTVNSSNISSLDRRDFLATLNGGLENNRHYKDDNYSSDSLEGAVRSVQSELGAAIAGTAPKYRYRKYLDQVINLQNDQPGQLQTILSKSGPFSNTNSILGGGLL